MSEAPLFGEVVAVSLDNIDATDRLRPLDPAHVELIAASIAQTGLQSPVILRPEGNRYRLVAGWHRLSAVRSLQWDSVDAIIQNLDDNEARLVEIDENLMRRELSALDRAVFLAERKAIYDALHPETTKPGRRKKELSQTLRQFGERFSKQAAKRTGLSERTVQMSLELASKLTPEAREALRLSPVADNQAALLKLAELDADEQISIAHEIAAGRAKTPKQARVTLGLDVIVETDPQERLFEQFLALWARAEQRTKTRIADHIAGAAKVKKRVGDL